MPKPKFDPNASFTEGSSKPAFDASKPFDEGGPNLMERLSGPVPKLPGNPYGVNDATAQVTTPDGVDEVFSRELLGKAGTAAYGAAKSVGSEVMSSPIAKALMHKLGLSSVSKLGPKFYEGLKGPVGSGLEVVGPTAAEAAPAAEQAAAPLAEALANKAKNAKWDFPVSKRLPPSSGDAF